MSEHSEELKISQKAIEIANKYRQEQRAFAEAERERAPEQAETEEEFLERVRAVSRLHPAGFSAPYPTPLSEIDEKVTEPVSVEDKIADGVRLDLVASSTTGDVSLKDLVEPHVDAGAALGREDAASEAARQSTAQVEEDQSGTPPTKDEDADRKLAEGDEETRNPEGATEVNSGGNTTIVDTGLTHPDQIAAAQGLANAEADAKAEEAGNPKVSTDAGPVEDPKPATDASDPKDEGDKPKEAATKKSTSKTQKKS